LSWLSLLLKKGYSFYICLFYGSSYYSAISANTNNTIQVVLSMCLGVSWSNLIIQFYLKMVNLLTKEDEICFNWIYFTIMADYVWPDDLLYHFHHILIGLYINTNTYNMLFQKFYEITTSKNARASFIFTCCYFLLYFGWFAFELNMIKTH